MSKNNNSFKKKINNPMMDFIISDANNVLEFDATINNKPIDNSVLISSNEPIKAYYKYIKNRINSIDKCLNNSEKCTRFDDNDLLSILEDIEKIRVQTRTIVPFISDTSKQEYDKITDRFKNIRIEEKKNCLIKITLFSLSKIPFKGAYNVYFEVRNALISYLQSNKIHLEYNTKYTLVYRRIVPENLVLGAGRCDNDNFEMKRTTNAICEAFGVADSIDKFSFFYTSAIGNDYKTEIYLVKENDFLTTEMLVLFDDF